MNRFEEDLRQAAVNKHKLLLTYTLTLILIGAIVSGYFLSFRSLSIKVTPQYAEQRATISVVGGMAITLGKMVYSLSDEVILEISAAKFQNVDITVSSADFGSELSVVLVPKPGRLRADVRQSIPVNWYIDGSFVTEANLLESELPPGEYKLAIVSEYHEKVERDIIIKADEDLMLDINLPVISGKLTVQMMPVGTLTVDGDEVDFSNPITLSPGPHIVELNAPGYFSISEKITITRSQRDFTRSYNLKPKPIQIRHNLKPENGELFINGKLQNLNKKSLLVPYRKEVSIEYTKPGFTTKRDFLTALPGEEINLAMNLEPELVDITVTANVGAEVFLDGQRLGMTPLKITVQSVPSMLELRANGYESVMKKIAPKTSQPLNYDFTLVDEEIAKLRNAPKKYTNAAGIEFLLIQPKGAEYQMGGKRSELGQRANEFIRKIKLQRPFYVATHELTEKQFQGKGAHKPIVNLSWEKVAKYANDLSIQEGLRPFYRNNNGRITGFNKEANGYRLITEAEWEFLARAYKRRKQTIFPWGDEPIVPPKVGNLAGDRAKPASNSYISGYQDGFSGIAPPKSFLADDAGLYDLVGNVSEWTNDTYSLEPPSSDEILVDPIGSFSAGSHVIKGSNFKSASRTELRAAFREGSDVPRDDVGYRLARYL